jgi:hypothetical protein
MKLIPILPRRLPSRVRSLACVCLQTIDRIVKEDAGRASPRATPSRIARGLPATSLFPPTLRHSKRPLRAALIAGFGGGCRRGHSQVIVMTSFVSATSEILPRRLREVNHFVFFFSARVASTLVPAPRRRPFSQATREIIPNPGPASITWFPFPGHSSMILEDLPWYRSDLLE